MTRLNRALEALGERFERLPSRARVAFFAVCGEALRPLYEEFVETSGWGDPGVLDRALEAAFAYARGEADGADAALLDDLLAVTPHSDDFAVPASTYAQDAVIAVDAAIRCSGVERCSGEWIYYLFEPMSFELSARDRGGYSGYRSPEDRAWYDAVPDDPAMRRALTFCDDALSELEAATTIDDALLDRLREGASALIPPRAPDAQSSAG